MSEFYFCDLIVSLGGPSLLHCSLLLFRLIVSANTHKPTTNTQTHLGTLTRRQGGKIHSAAGIHLRHLLPGVDFHVETVTLHSRENLELQFLQTQILEARYGRQKGGKSGGFMGVEGRWVYARLLQYCSWPTVLVWVVPHGAVITLTS